MRSMIEKSFQLESDGGSQGEADLLDTQGDDWLWRGYLQRFPVGSAHTLRKGCSPLRMVHPLGKKKAIVLIHGLTDSPYFMKALGRFFYTTLGYNVYIPLLQSHGLAEPQGMSGVSLEAWKENVRFSIQQASHDGRQVSIGGLSMGGVLSCYMACTEAAINGDLYLFAAALGLAPGICGIPGRLKEFLLRLPFAGLLDNGRPLIGDNPYRYERVSLNGAVELSRLIKEVDVVLKKPDRARSILRTFAAWSEYDKVINREKLENFKQLAGRERFSSFVVPEKYRVDHASLVLEEPIFVHDAPPGQPPVELANPCFQEMTEAISRFEASG